VQVLVVCIADRYGARIGIRGINVVKVDEPGARVGRISEENLNEAALARKVAPVAPVVDRSLHRSP
jgi:hypothetical protein